MEDKDIWTPTLHKDRAAAILIVDGKILVIHRFREGKEYWVLPGGSIEEGETKDGALAREVQEELGLEIEEKKYLFSVHNSGRKEHHYLIMKYSGTPALGGPEAQRASEQDQYILTWIPVEDLKKLNDFYPAEAVEKLTLLWERKEI